MNRRLQNESLGSGGLPGLPCWVLLWNAPHWDHASLSFIICLPVWFLRIAGRTTQIKKISLYYALYKTILRDILHIKKKLTNQLRKGPYQGISLTLLLLLLSCFSCVRLCATPWTAAHQAPLSLGFSRQEYWSRLPFPSPMHESESEVAQSCPTLRNPMNRSLPGSSVHGIFQTRVLEWVAISFSKECWGITVILVVNFPEVTNR